MSENTNGNVPTSAGRPPKKQYNVFISYRRRSGKDLALALMYWFSSKRIECFVDVVGLEAGEYKDELYSVIENAKYFLVLLTDDALESEWVRKEIQHAREKLTSEQIIPISIDKEYNENDYENNSLIKGLQGFSVRHDNFEGSLEKVVEKGMKNFKGMLSSYDERIGRLLSSMRWYKRNDGEIDDKEWKEVQKAATVAGIDDATVHNLKTRVEEEWSKEQNFIKANILPRYKSGHKIDLKEHGDLQESAEKCGISQDRLNELILSVNAKQAGVRRLLWVIGSMAGVVCLAVLVWFVAWWQGREVGNEEAHGRNAKVIAQLKAEAKKEKQSADSAKVSIEKAKRDAQDAKAAAEKSRLAAEKRAAVASLAREQAERETKEIKAQLETARKTAADSDVARRDAETRLAQAQTALETERAEWVKNKEIVEGRCKELLSTLAKEQAARKNAEVLSAEKSVELERAAKSVQALESEKAKLAKELEELRVKYLELLRGN